MNEIINLDKVSLNYNIIIKIIPSIKESDKMGYFYFSLLDKIIEIDETLFGKKRKFNRGKYPTIKKWFFGGIERERGKWFGEMIENRSSEILIPKVDFG